MPGRTIRLSKAQVEELVLVRTLGPERLEEIAVSLERLGSTIDSSRIEKALRVVVTQREATVLWRLLFGLANAVRRERMSLEDLLSRIAVALEETESWTGEQVAEWQRSQPPLGRILDSRSVKLAAKATDLSYDFAQIFLSARILTGLRPVFDEGRKDVEGVSITQTLRLDYTSLGHRETGLSIAMDETDLRALYQSCEDALSKAAVLKKKAVEEWKVETIIPGSSTNE